MSSLMAASCRQVFIAKMTASWEPVRVVVEGNGSDAGSERGGLAAHADQPAGIGPDVVEDGLEFAGVVGIRGTLGFDFDRNAEQWGLHEKVNHSFTLIWPGQYAPSSG